VIAQAYLNEWASRAPWSQQVQVEQDLILSRLIVEIAQHELLRDELAFRGGTCLHKLHLPAPLRYSEDLDYVRRTHSGIKPYLTAIREIALGVGLVERGTDRSGQMVHIVFDGEPTNAPGRIRIKIETNITETESFLPRVTRPFWVKSGWWRGEAEVSTFEPDELMATKLRALYQRRKGRDLFDLWLVLTELDLDGQRVVDGLAHYMRDELFSYSEFASNLAPKLEHPDFVADIEQLTADVAQRYDVTAAADLVMERLGSRLPGAPGLDEVRGGRWRSADV
jgi:predicted nucleotidyltransferase component of viral defense system